MGCDELEPHFFRGFEREIDVDKATLEGDFHFGAGASSVYESPSANACSRARDNADMGAVFAVKEMSLRSTRRQAVWSLFALGVLVTQAGAAPADDDDDNEIPNTFISPCGQPFRAPRGAPYPVVDWFKAADKNADGKVDHAEFVADAAAFFTLLDVDNDGVLSHLEVARYEQQIAPEILGARIRTSWNGARLWLAQVDRPGPIDPGGGQPSDDEDAKPPPIDESAQGAAPYGLLVDPEPVLAADLDLNGLISRKNFLKVADMHFHVLDTMDRGYLTLETLPKTQVQRLLGKVGPKKRRS